MFSNFFWVQTFACAVRARRRAPPATRTRFPATTTMTDDERPEKNQFLTTGGLSCQGIVPRFDLEHAKRLMEKGARPDEVMAAAVRLGDERLRRAIEALTRS